jgi:hypothetical protein
LCSPLICALNEELLNSTPAWPARPQATGGQRGAAHPACMAHPPQAVPPQTVRMPSKLLTCPAQAPT